MQTVIPPLTAREEIFQAALDILRNGDRKPAAQFPEVKSKRKAYHVERLGPVSVPVYKAKWRDKKRRRTYVKFEVRALEIGFRRRRSNFDQAKALAEDACRKILNGQTAQLHLSQADLASFLRARELLKKIGDPPIESAIGIYLESVQILKGVSLLEAARFYSLHHPAGQIPKAAADVVAEMFARRQISDKWKRNLSLILDRFTNRFPGPLSQLVARELDDWLDAIKDNRGKKLGLAARRNHRAAVLQLSNFAKTRGYLPNEWRIMESVSDPVVPDVEVNLYTPEELLRLLNTAEAYEAGRKLVPFIAITAFAGVRHGEMNEDKIRLLDWADFDFDTKTINVQKKTAKTGADRTIDMPDNLIAWLKPYARARGKVVPLKNTSNAFCRLRMKAGIKGPKRNALRKSFVSYKRALSKDIAATADQAGNSPAVIKKFYARTDNLIYQSARRWFSLMPDRADLLPLFAWVKK